MTEARHLSLASEAALVAAECGALELLHECRNSFHAWGADLRLLDVALIEAGGSAVKQYGL